MAIKALKDAGFDKDNHILTLVRKAGQPIRGEVRVKDEDGKFVTFSSPLPIARALDLIRCSHNADVMNGKNLGHVLPKTAEAEAALARAYEVSHLV